MGISNTTLVAGLLAVALLVSAMGTFTAVTKFTGFATGTANATVLEATDITLVVTGINFGALSIGASADTTSGSPAPFKIQNDGSVNVDVTIESTALWSSAAAVGTDYQFKCNGAGGGRVVACGAGSVDSFTNVPIGSATQVIGTLPFDNTGDQNKVDIKVTVPNKEPAGAKSATVTFTATAT